MRIIDQLYCIWYSKTWYLQNNLLKCISQRWPIHTYMYLFTKRWRHNMETLSALLALCREIRTLRNTFSGLIVLKLDRHLGCSAVNVSVKVQNNTIILTSYLADSMLGTWMCLQFLWRYFGANYVFCFWDRYFNKRTMDSWQRGDMLLAWTSCLNLFQLFVIQYSIHHHGRLTSPQCLDWINLLSVHDSFNK